MIGNGGFIGKKTIIGNSHNIYGLDDFYQSRDNFTDRSFTYVGGTSSVHGANGTSLFFTSLTGLSGGSNTSPQPNDIVVVLVAANTITTNADIEIFSGSGVFVKSFSILIDEFQSDSFSSRLVLGIKKMGAVPDTGLAVRVATSVRVAVQVMVFRGQEVKPYRIQSVIKQPNTAQILLPSIIPLSRKNVVLVGGISAMPASTSRQVQTTGFTRIVRPFSFDTTSSVSSFLAAELMVDGPYNPPSVTYNTALQTATTQSSIGFALVLA